MPFPVMGALAAVAALPAVIDLGKALFSSKAQDNTDLPMKYQRAIAEAEAQGLDPAMVDQYIQSQQGEEDDGIAGKLANLAMAGALALPAVGAARGGLGAAKAAWQAGKGMSKAGGAYKELVMAALKGASRGKPEMAGMFQGGIRDFADA